MSNSPRKGLLVGYARTFTTEQEAGLQAQVRDLQAAGCTKIFQEQVSSIAERAEDLRDSLPDAVTLSLGKGGRDGQEQPADPVARDVAAQGTTGPTAWKKAVRSAADDVAEQLPPLAVEGGELHAKC